MIVPGEGVTWTFGAGSPKGNFGSLRTRGWELSIDYNHRFENGLGINAMVSLSDAFAYLGTTAGFITLGVSAIACIGSLILFMRSKTLDKVALKKNITSKVDRTAADQVKVGDTGVAITRLALIGNAEIDGNIVEVKSMDGFLNEKTPIIVNRITDGVIMVEKKKD